MNRKLIAILISMVSLNIYNLMAQQTITIDQERSINHGISIDVPNSTPLKHFFQNGKISDVTGTDANFGISVTVETETEINYKGNPLIEKIYIVYSNLKTTNVEIDDLIDSETIIGISGGVGTKLHEGTDDLYIYVYTEKYSPLMNRYTKNAYIEEDDIYWWDPSFLLQS